MSISEVILYISCKVSSVNNVIIIRALKRGNYNGRNARNSKCKY